MITNYLLQMPDGALKQLEANFGQMINRLDGDGRARNIRLGTMCSGSELGVPAFKQLVARLCALFGHQDIQFTTNKKKRIIIIKMFEHQDVTVEHTFACESSPRIRKWIAANFPPSHLFGGVEEMAATFAYDYMSGDDQPIPTVDFLVAGFSCKNLSTLNRLRRLFADCMKTGADSTGA